MQLGPYRCEAVLGRGATATVYRALDLRSGRAVALKVLLPDMSKSPRMRRRFETEVQALTRLHHENAIRVYDAGATQDQLWLALELIEGRSLATRLMDDGPLSVDETLAVGRAVAAGLGAAHAAGILHRDVKPDNVLLATNGRIVLTDFGIARDEESTEGLSRLTRSGVFMGTPGYWAPEQARGRLDALGPATDVYGLGATLYACLVGQPPITGENLVAFLRSGVFNQITPVGQRADLPPWLERVIARCLEVEPQARYPDANALLEALLAQVAEPAPRRGRALPAVLLALALLGAAAAFALWPRYRPPAAPGAPIGLVPRWQRELTWALTRARLTAAAEATASVSVQAAPRWAEAWAARAFARAREGDQEGARLDAARALELDPDCALAYVARAEAAIVVYDGANAEADRDRALALAPDLPYAHVVDGGVLRLQERYGKAEEAYRRAIELDPSLPQAYSELGFMLVGRLRYAEALEAYARCLELTPWIAEDWRNHGRMLYHQERYEEALRDLDRALELGPGHPVGLNARGMILAKLERYEEALRDLERALAPTPQDLALLNYVALMHYKLGHFSQALDYYSRAAEVDPSSGEAHLNRALVLRRLGRDGEALRAYDLAIQFLPFNVEAYGGRGQLRVAARDFAGAKADFERALALEPDHMPSRVGRALACAELGEFEQAVSDMQVYLDSGQGQGTPERARFEGFVRQWKRKLR